MAILLASLFPACSSTGVGVADTVHKTSLGSWEGEGVRPDGRFHGGMCGGKDNNRQGPLDEGGGRGGRRGGSGGGGGGCPWLQTLDLSDNSLQSADSFRALALLLSPPVQPERPGWGEAGARGLSRLRLRRCGLNDVALELLALSLESASAAAGGLCPKD